MTDNEIIKALREMGAEYEGNFSNAVLGLINRQKAEIERLNKANLSLVERLKKARKQRKGARADAIKAFAERLKGKIRMNGFCEEFVFRSDIDNLVKEMVGDAE